jgi:hypothetical protein
MGSHFTVTHVETYHIVLDCYQICHYIIMSMYAFLFNWTEDFKLSQNVQGICKNYLLVSTYVIVFLKKSKFFLLKTKSHSIKALANLM